jgi:DNA-binding MarR family transcriptional regulator
MVILKLPGVMIVPKKYLMFLELLSSHHDANHYPNLSLQEQNLLNYIFVRLLRNKPCSVLSCINDKDNGSPSAAHRYLKGLRLKGYINLTQNEVDNRIKTIELTALADEFIQSFNIQNFDEALL